MTERTVGLSIGMVTIDCADPQAQAGFWTQVLGASVAADYGDYVVLAPPGPGATGIGLQRVPEERAGKNRVHIDLTGPDPDAQIERVVGLGARVLATHKVPGLTWTVLADPEGNEFCIANHGDPAELG
ncbi:putative enzyme related to lactoylglutathione lyase [Crossiella cryophila]|uniref:Putative enzyme related to lactoylglutathione lyase n=1 Tax=Crossiella cryophila TaxID=43355 RepID=A0A7W7CIN7_9PSEU|nr:putative enzyme related to lactoylglutathione lyase [Crossiella cryophila]